MPSPPPLLSVLLASLSLVAGGCLYGASPPVLSTEPRADATAAARPEAVPFGASEELCFSVAWGAVPAGWLTVATERAGDGFVLRAAGGSTGLASLLYALDATLETRADAHGWPSALQLTCRQEEHRHLRRLTFGKRVVVSWRDLRRPLLGTAVVECPAPWDPLTMLAALRRAPEAERDAEFEVVLGRRAELYRVQYRGCSEVVVPAGTFAAAHSYLVEARPVFARDPERVLGPPLAQYRLYLADDAERTPLLLEYDLRVGTLQIRLVSVERHAAEPLAL